MGTFFRLTNKGTIPNYTLPLCYLHFVAASCSYWCWRWSWLCNLGWWCFSCHQLAQRLHLHFQWVSPATYTGGAFIVPTSTFTNVWLTTMLPAPSCKTSAHLYVCTLVNSWLVQEKHHQCKLQIVLTASASEVFALIDGRKSTTSASCTGSRPSWALVVAGCSNQIQAALGQGSVRVCTLVQVAIGCCILVLLVRLH